MNTQINIDPVQVLGLPSGTKCETLFKTPEEYEKFYLNFVEKITPLVRVNALARARSERDSMRRFVR